MNGDFDLRAFRSALGAFATGVTIITTRDSDDRDVGLTANSFNSVSLDPPMVLWSLANSSGSLPAFMTSNYFAVHILADHQESLSNRFSTRGVIDKFEGVDIERGAGGVPLLPGCAASFQCRTAFQYEGGDHTIFVGEVLAFDHSARPPLLYHGGKYATAAQRADRVHSTEYTANRWGDTLGHLLSRAYLELLDPVRQRGSDLGLSMAAQHVLRFLFGTDQSSYGEMNAVIAYTGIEVTSAVIDKLIRDGMVQVSGPLSDRAPLCLTETGRKIIVELHAFALAKEAEASLRVGAESMHMLRKLLQRLVAEVAPAESRVAKHLNALQNIILDRETIGNGAKE